MSRRRRRWRRRGERHRETEREREISGGLICRYQTVTIV